MKIHYFNFFQKAVTDIMKQPAYLLRTHLTTLPNTVRLSAMVAAGHTTASHIDPSWKRRSSAFSPQNSRNSAAWRVAKVVRDTIESCALTLIPQKFASTMVSCWNYFKEVKFSASAYSQKWNTCCKLCMILLKATRSACLMWPSHYVFPITHKQFCCLLQATRFVCITMYLLWVCCGTFL